MNPDHVTPDPLYWAARHEIGPTWQEVWHEQITAVWPKPWVDERPLSGLAAALMTKRKERR